MKGRQKNFFDQMFDPLVNKLEAAMGQAVPAGPSTAQPVPDTIDAIHISRARALSLYEPWASLVTLGAKQYETRSWSTRYRGLVVIHASQNREYLHQMFAHTFYEVFKEVGILQPNQFVLGAAVGVAWLEDVLPVERLWSEIGSIEKSFGDYSEGRFAWKFARPMRFETPIPIRGAQGLWEWPSHLAALLEVYGG